MDDGAIRLWGILLLAIWLVPLAAWLIEHRVLQKLFRQDRSSIRKLSRFEQVAVFVLLMFAIVYGGSKPSQSQPRRPVPPGGVQTGSPDAGADGENATNSFFIISGFDVSSEEKTVRFEVSWSDDAFDAAESRYADLFMSTNLSEKKKHGSG